MNKQMRAFLIYILLSTLTACKKDNNDKLEGEISFLVGKWEWQYSISHYTNYYLGIVNSTDTIYSSELPDTYQLEFHKEGRIRFLKNDQENTWYDLIFRSLETGNCGSIACGRAGITINSKDYPRLGMGFLSLTKMSTSDTNIPLNSDPYEYGSIYKTYSHYYKKVE